MAESHTSVLVVGGGPVGLALSCLLSAQGVGHVLVEARPATSRHPRARGVSARSMEIFRRMGLENAVRAAGLPAEQVSFYRGRDLVDPDYVRTGPAQEPGEGGPEHTPSPGLVCSQDVLEPLLLRRARELAGPRVRFGTRLLSFRDDGLGVQAVVEERATGRRYRLRADWLVGCDGASSTVRAGAGITMEGPTGLGRYLSIRFGAPLGQVVADRVSASYFLTVPGRGGFMAVDNDRHWIYQYPLGPDPGAAAGPGAAADTEAADPAAAAGTGAAADVTDHRFLAGLVRTAAGVPDLDVTVRDTMTWRMDARLARSYRSSRVLLAGDAAHVVPPTGGHGMNTGIGDADNLAWKLAAVTAGHAGDALLDTYEAERRPLARQVIDISTANAANRTGYRIDDELLLTAAYRSPAVVPGPEHDDRPSALDPAGCRPCCRPGERVPHVRLTTADAADEASTLDLVGPGFTLLTADDDPRWQPHAEAVRRAGIPLALRAVRTASRREAEPGQWARLLGAGHADTALLVRPDGHIAWRGVRPADPAALPALVRRVLAAP
ncbi:MULTISPECIES: FAD-dependent monooxygenase [unclassified Streptomyces]|uniref:FAD-dependent monooxygenase n=1 Tax=unclassified Streptomyces TaxID=2593676 RepID=UPI00136BA331|nr:2-polyprenyl-6-methoxyphenol hydroxylase [Streptomyces sp. SID6139]MYR20714.1 2-polyprenyl-6-methoxyphenol hydroxylase [Streptomyces sp. SID6137]